MQVPPGRPAGPIEQDFDLTSAGCLFCHGATDVDDVIGDDAETNPAVHSDKSLVSAACEAVAPLGHADASFTSGAPFLTVAEPALFLLALALRAFGGAIGDADAFDTFRARSSLILDGVERSIRRHQARRASQPCLMRLDGGDEQVRIVRPPSVDFVIGYDLILGLL